MRRQRVAPSAAVYRSPVFLLLGDGARYWGQPPLPSASRNCKGSYWNYTDSYRIFTDSYRKFGLSFV